MTVHRRAASASAALAILLAAAAARAEESGEGAYYEGLEAFRAGDLPKAEEEFRTAIGTLPLGNPLILQARYNLARTAQKAGRDCDAAAKFREYLTAARGAGPIEARRIPVVEGELRSLETRCPTTAAAAPASASPLPAIALVTSTQAARPLGSAPPARVVRKPAPGIDASASPAVPPSTGASSQWRTSVGFGGLAAGAVGLSLGTVFLIRASNDADLARQVSPNERARYDRLSGDFDTQMTLSIVSLSLGMLLAGGGAALLLWPYPDAQSETAARSPTRAWGLTF